MEASDAASLAGFQRNRRFPKWLLLASLPPLARGIGISVVPSLPKAVRRVRLRSDPHVEVPKNRDVRDWTARRVAAFRHVFASCIRMEAVCLDDQPRGSGRTGGASS